MADEEDDGGEVQEDVQDQEYAGGGLDETSDSSAGDEELDGDQDDLDNRPAVVSAGPSTSGDSLLNGSSHVAVGIKEPPTLRPPIWQSVGNVSGQAVTFKGMGSARLSHPPPPGLMVGPALCAASFCRWLLI